ncbi:MAG: TetR/AcrR family transcriptional regulator [Brevundimonas sp.]|uniref:TetR/AcrR family transcriptional regulator n=1 Tax=Brevundimonas sp. TaxID=1871086 RepID=UPI00271FBCF0|nr:TetR/AcrR family transcriptional regulator [Brevundimonas sp.]MDO9586956.1 TetR/AcrR family transcriptional regulator [Brevundimonas sp.]MDP3368435.1 TetR/AcrR family transcriptional regulator [Brevundimonas sp.]MDP3657107.1 TetR/AcrR family transcriptional regulator [Brevundimonas sp.]MDZ4113790.1 TetR/AcrR family transcriptional regulator [Brevundimonas sp.]
MHGPRVRQPPPPDPRRQAIIRTARDSFVRDGYAATRIEPIARAAGVSTATLYALFDGKAALFSAVIDDAAEDFGRQMRRVRVGEGDARQQLVSFAETYAGFMSDPFVRSVFRLVMAERPRFKAVALRFFEKGRAEFGASLIAILTALSEAGALRAIEKPSWAAGQLMGMLEHPVFLVPLVTGDEIRARRSIQAVVDDAVETFLARYGP